MTTALEQLSDFTARLALDNVPPAVVEHAKLLVLDALTATVAAVRTPAGQIVAHALDPVDEGGPAHVVATGATASVNTAAFVNTQMSLYLDLTSNLYGATVLCALNVFGPLAVAESLEASGAQLLQAVIAGYEVGGRIGLSFPSDWDVEDNMIVGPTQLGGRWSALGAAAANAKIRSLDKSRTAHALALVAASVPARAPKHTLAGQETPMAKKYSLLGSYATSAIAAALLAERGFTGDLQILDDAGDGLHQAWESECADADAMTRGLGQRWLTTDAGFKRYPHGTHNQQAIHTLDKLLREHRIDPDRIRAVRVGRAIGTTGQFANPKPGNDVAAQYSIPFAVAATALRVPPREWPTCVAEERIKALAARVQLVQNTQAMQEFIDRSPEERHSLWPLRTHVSIETADGNFESWSDYGDVPYQELADKFRHYCEGTLTSAQIVKILDTVSTLDRVTDIRKLTSWFES